MPKNSSVFPFKDRSELTEQMQLVYDKSVLRRGEAKLISAMAHAPELFDWYIEEFYNKLFYSNNVPKIYKELGRLRLSQVHGHNPEREISGDAGPVQPEPQLRRCNDEVVGVTGCELAASLLAASCERPRFCRLA